MKLIDLLVQELPKRGGWPEGAKFITQDGPSAYSGGNVVSTWGVLPELRKHMKNREYWTAAGHNNGYGIKCFHDFELCQDYLSSIVARQEYEAALAASKRPVWDGKSNPPIGVTCEHCPGGTTQTEWEVVTVLGISERPGGGFTDYWLRKENGSSYIIGNPYRFRPIRTEAERRREETVDEIVQFYIDYHSYPKGAEEYLRVATALHDAIAAGKIRGVKLDLNNEA